MEAVPSGASRPKTGEALMVEVNTPTSVQRFSRAPASLGARARSLTITSLQQLQLRSASCVRAAVEVRRVSPGFRAGTTALATERSNPTAR